MNITFLIGNGFDINIGLKTRYQNFYDYLKDSGNMKKLTSELNEKSNVDFDKVMWSDLELGLSGLSSICRIMLNVS